MSRVRFILAIVAIVGAVAWTCNAQSDSPIGSLHGLGLEPPEVEDLP